MIGQTSLSSHRGLHCTAPTPKYMPSHVFFTLRRPEDLLVQFNTSAALGPGSDTSTRRQINLLWIKVGISPRSVTLYYGMGYCY